jgi:hypothetical protein
MENGTHQIATNRYCALRFGQFTSSTFIIMSLVLTIYLVKSFEYRTMKTMVIKDVDVNMKASELLAQIITNILLCPPPQIPLPPRCAGSALTLASHIQNQSAYVPYRNATLGRSSLCTLQIGDPPLAHL